MDSSFEGSTRHGSNEDQLNLRPPSLSHKGHTKPEVQFKTTPRLNDRKTKPAPKLKKKPLRLEKYPELRIRFVEPLLADQEQTLQKTVKELMEPGKGILSVDDSIRLLEKKLKQVFAEPKEDDRRRYLEMLLGANHHMRLYLSGVVFREKVIDQRGYMGRRLVTIVKEAGLKLGIRVDRALVRIPGTLGEWATDGLDTYEDTCARLKNIGAEFVMWRCVYTTTGLITPSNLALQVNSNTLARFASISQKMGLVPIVAVEVLWEPGQSAEDCQNVVRQILSSLFKSLQEHQVFIEGTIVRVPAIYLPNYTAQTIADVTMKVVNQTLPPAIGGLYFSSLKDLSLSLVVLDAINKCPIKKPTIISFCFSNVIQEGVLDIWGGNDKNVTKVIDELLRRFKSCSIAAMGQCPEPNQTIFVTNITVL
uniref:fructose-bisphosphate aldolase n=1 Tax=Biomphalaria glabrata TaxID=6526 RepID=A0A2C9KLJ4_BIOGL